MLTCFTLLFDDQDCVRWHVTTKIIYVIIHLLEDEQELSLGMLIRPKRIHNFCLCHAYIAPLLHVLIQLLYHFESFFWTNLLTRCPVPVPVFCMFLVSEKLHRKNSRKKSRKSSSDASSSPCLPPVRCVSSSSLDYGSIAVARWLSSPVVLPCLDLVSWDRKSVV